MIDILIHKLTIIAIAVITMTELIIREDISNSILLWVFYGVYKLLKHN